MSRWWGRWGSMIALAGIAAGCVSSPAASDRRTSTALDGLDVVGDPDVTLVGEAFLDLGWPSEFREGCLTIDDGAGHVEIVADESWSAGRDDDTGWFEITDEAGTVVAREHRLVTVRGDFLDRQGCREGRLFRVDDIVPLAPAGSATLRIDVVYPEEPIFVEGSVNVVRVLVDGVPVFQEPVEPGQSIAVPGGPIQVINFQKPCSGNCAQAYGSELACEVALDLAAGATATLSLTLAEDGCTAEVRTGRSAGSRSASLSGTAEP